MQVVHEMVNQCDSDASGNINYEEFAKHIKRADTQQHAVFGAEGEKM